MKIEEAFEIIFEHYGDIGTILGKIKDKEVLAQLMQFDFFSEMIIEYYSKNSKRIRAATRFN